ncbi:MAG: phosphate acyltransferase PlsX [Kiritimatiellae bacterium]|nr:phosphate acyltransferase PlsX [Kiritimatiellia bacterium]
MTRVALDAMGGDNAPGAIVRGGVDAALGLEDVKVFLVGRKDTIEAEFVKYPPALFQQVQAAIADGRIEVVHAPDVAEMDDAPAKAVRAKRDCSINVAMRLVKAGKADCFVSAGNSGAVSASAMFTLGRIRGVDRPAIATVLPTRLPRRPLLLLDAGANMDCHPEWLVQFAVMGSAYSHAVLNRTTPLVGLLSIGTEDCKGNDLTKSAFPMLKRVDTIDFRGNVEGHDLFQGQTDVVVCDGFVGNVVLKTTESVCHAMGYWMKREFRGNFWRTLGSLLLLGAFKAIKRQVDPEIYGGAPLLGVPGAVVIAHGSSSAKAIYHAIKAGVTGAKNDMTGEISRRIADYELQKKTEEEQKQAEAAAAEALA